jgi:hypothetical protein
VARRTLIFLAAGLLAAAGCFGGPPPPPPPPPQPTQVCSQSFGTANQYQSSFFNLAHAGTNWVTADGFVPVAMPDGTTGWWMSDTMTGTANPDNSVSNGGFRHNTLVQQDDSCLTPKLGSPDTINGTGGAWYWPGSAVIQDNTMLVFAHKLVPAPGPPGFDWETRGASMARFSLPSLQLLGPPVDMPHNSAPNGGDDVPWGIRSYLNPVDGMVYLYGTTKYVVGSFAVVADAWLARAPFSQPTNLEYFTNPLLPTDPAWSTNFADAEPMTFTKNALPGASPLAQISVVPYGDGFLAGAFEADTWGNEQGRSFVRAWVSDTPHGPWQMVVDVTGEPQTVATFERRNADQIAYGATITQLPGAGWTVVYSANDPNSGFSDFTLYRGEFATPAGLPPP